MTTELLPIVGYGGKYSISRGGRVWSRPNHMHAGRWLKPALRKGYEFVSLVDGSVKVNASIHRLVAKAFIPNPLNHPQINHRNGYKTDNRVRNLEWCTASHNKKHSWDIGTTVTTQAKRLASRRNAYHMHKINAERRANEQ